MSTPSDQEKVSNDFTVMESVLKNMGITDYEPRVVNQMMDFSYKYITDVLDDARIYCQHAGKTAVDEDDIRLAIQMKLDRSFTTPPPRELLLDLAQRKNSQPLPAIKTDGVKLPPERFCMTAPNVQLKAKRPTFTPTHPPVPVRLPPGAMVTARMPAGSPMIRPPVPVLMTSPRPVAGGPSYMVVSQAHPQAVPMPMGYQQQHIAHHMSQASQHMNMAAASSNPVGSLHQAMSPMGKPG